MANTALENVLFEELNSEPTRPSDVDFTESYELYKQAVNFNPNNQDARLGTAVTGMLILAADTEVNAAFDEWDAYLADNTPFSVSKARRKPLGVPIGFASGGEAVLLPFEVVPMSVLAFARTPIQAADPQLGRLQDILRERVIPKIGEALEHLALVAADAEYTFTVTPRMQGDEFADPAEIDQTDVLALRAGLGLLNAACRIAVSYNLDITTYDDAGLLEAFTPGSGWMTLATDGADQMAAARTDMLAAVDDLDAALEALLAETDDQSDDIIKIGPSDLARADVDSIQANLPNVRNLLNDGYTRIDDWDNNPATPERPLKISLGNLLQNPVMDWKAKLPNYTASVTIVAGGSSIREQRPETIQFTVAQAGTYFAYYSVFVSGGEPFESSFGHEELTGSVRDAVLRQIAILPPGSCAASDIAAWTDVQVTVAAGTHTAEIVVHMSVDRCFYAPVITWEADTFEQWTWPDPNLNGLLPDVTGQNEVYDIFGIDGSGWEKETILDWTGFIPKPVSVP